MDILFPASLRFAKVKPQVQLSSYNLSTGLKSGVARRT